MSYGLESVLDYVEAHLADDLSLEELARVSRFGRWHFAKSFKRTVGVSPHAFVLRRRIERACELIRDSGRPIVDIAFEVGFSSQSHFTAAFRKFTATTPRVYRLSRGN